jgi:hypothetical protein
MAHPRGVLKSNRFSLLNWQTSNILLKDFCGVEGLMANPFGAPSDLKMKAPASSANEARAAIGRAAQSDSAYIIALARSMPRVRKPILSIRAGGMA